MLCIIHLYEYMMNKELTVEQIICAHLWKCELHDDYNKYWNMCNLDAWGGGGGGGGGWLLLPYLTCNLWGNPDIIYIELT